MLAGRERETTMMGAKDKRLTQGITALLTVLMGLGGAQAQAVVERPRITGISHVGYFVSDLPKAVGFWHGLLGYDESYTLNKPGSTDVRIAFIKINDHQHVELFTDPPVTPRNMLSHVCFAVSDVEQMRRFLRSKGYDVKAGDGGKAGPSKTRTGDYAFEIKDPDGVLIEFVQSLPTGWEVQAKGKFLPESRISDGIYHAGYMVSDARKTIEFYRMLGFTETWRGSSDEKELSWINMKVPDGSDYVELMLYHGAPDPKSFGGKNHLSLMVPDMAKAVAELKARPAFAEYGKDVTPKTGVNGKRQVNLYDPDGTRVELMEPFTLDGNARPSSNAPVPVGVPLAVGDPTHRDETAMNGAQRPFVHPGVLLSRAQLDFVKAQVKAKSEPFYTEFERAKASEFGDLHYVVKGPPVGGVIDCGSYSRPNNGCSDEDKDGSAAYVQALLWYITGEHAYAANSIAIMNTYARNLKGYTNSNAPLQAAWGSEKWPRAAEIIRYSNAGWADADVKAFSAMLTDVVLPLIYKGSGSNGNWELSMVEAMMGIAVFNDDHALFDHAVTMWKERVPAYFYYAAKDGDKPVPAPRGTSLWLTQKVWDKRVDGIPQEACRDFGHTAYGIAAAMNAAETAHIQGVPLYESEQGRLMAAMEFVAFYELKNPVPEYVCEGKLKLSEGATFVIGYNEFHNRLGLELPNTKKWIEEDVMKDPFPTDGGGHMILFEPLTHAEDAGKKN